jgi:hypothetical protein
LGPLDEVLEAVETASYSLGPRQAEQELRRLDKHRHLVPVVLASMMESVHGRPNRRTEDRAALD